jgi:sulfite reductase alpha subunit-like flavoprotein
MAKLHAQELRRTLQDVLHDHRQCCQDATKTLLRQPHGLYSFVVSTTVIGEPPDHARDFYQWIMTTTTTDEGSKTKLLTGLENSVFGLGNSQAYPQHFNVKGKSLDEPIRNGSETRLGSSIR